MKKCVLVLVLLPIILIGEVHGLDNPSRKTWWAKRVASDDFYAAGRLSERQIKYASEAGFKSIVSLFTFNEHVGDVTAPGGSYLPSTVKGRYTAEDLAEITFDTVLTSGEEWKNEATLQKLFTIIRMCQKKLLFFCDDAHGSTFLLLAHFANVTKHDDNRLGEPKVYAMDVFKIGADLGYDYGNDEVLVNMIKMLTGTTELENLPTPDINSNDWYRYYWQMKPIYKNIFIAGQFQSDHLEAIAAAGIKTIVNSRKGKTMPPGKLRSQEEVTLLNIKGKTGTYSGTGRQTKSELEANRINPLKPNAYINPGSMVNYESRNPLEFGDSIGYNEKIERKATKKVRPRMKYKHIPVGGYYDYSEHLWGAHGRKVIKANNRGLLLLHCRSSFRSGVVGVMTAAYTNCYNSTWADEKSKAIGLDIPNKAPSAVEMFQQVLDGRDECEPGFSGPE